MPNFNFCAQICDRFTKRFISLVEKGNRVYCLTLKIRLNPFSKHCLRSFYYKKNFRLSGRCKILCLGEKTMHCQQLNFLPKAEVYKFTFVDSRNKPTVFYFAGDF